MNSLIDNGALSDLSSESYHITEEGDIHAISQAACRYALTAGFDDYRSAKIALSVSEIVTNAYRYASHGAVVFEKTDNGKGIRFTIQDQGTGIADIEQAMQDGFTTYGDKSLGVGLSAAKRASDEFFIISSNNGTTVVLEHYLPLVIEDMNYGQVSFPSPERAINGDQTYVKSYHGENLLIAVVDGAGTGKKANESARKVVETIAEMYREPLDLILRQAHQTLLSSRNLTRGAEIGLVRVTPTAIEYIILGNVRLYIKSEKANHVEINSGSLGLSLPQNLKVSKIARPTEFILTLHSDGIEFVDYDRELQFSQSPLKISESIFNNFANPADDSSIVTIKAKNHVR